MWYTCGSKKIKDSKIISKQITDIECIPECKTTTCVMHECICADWYVSTFTPESTRLVGHYRHKTCYLLDLYADCNAITKPESIGLEGTSL